MRQHAGEQATCHTTAGMPYLSCLICECANVLVSFGAPHRWLAQLLMNVGFPDAAAALGTDIINPTPLTAA